MSSKRSGWISRRGQADAAVAIDQVIERQALAGEQVQHLPDAQIEDSPYQARQPFNDMNVEDLAQGMREAGFQGVLIVRPHSDLAKRHRGLMQLVYGHRRRAAWRSICAERGQPCLLPVVVRDISDAQILTIGAQENLQRQDLDPVEEAQLVAWHEQVFFEKNQAELGAMLGKSSDWVSVRSRIHKLPEGLKKRLRRRPRSIAQMLELGSFYMQQPDEALTIADRVAQENLTLDAVRRLIRGYARPEIREETRASSEERRGAATKVQKITNDLSTNNEQHLNPQFAAIVSDTPDTSDPPPGAGHPAVVPVAAEVFPPDAQLPVLTNEVRLRQVTETLTHLASHADALPVNKTSRQLLDQLETALFILRRAFSERTSE